ARCRTDTSERRCGPHPHHIVTVAQETGHLVDCFGMNSEGSTFPQRSDRRTAKTQRASFEVSSCIRSMTAPISAMDACWYGTTTEVCAQASLGSPARTALITASQAKKHRRCIVAPCSSVPLSLAPMKINVTDDRVVA